MNPIVEVVVAGVIIIIFSFVVLLILEGAGQ